jgi:hypothetical protein
MQEICISDAEALSKLLPGEPCLPEGCNCQADGDCPGENGRCVACKCQECAQSPKGSEIFNPPLTFVIDTTKSVKPDKDSIFNLTQKGTFSIIILIFFDTNLLIEKVPFCVRLKMESLSGLTDFVVSITNVRGGLNISDPFGDCAHS